jgi:hypothetical protein
MLLTEESPGHTGMDLRNEFIRLTCNSRASALALPRFGTFRVFPGSGKGEQPYVFRAIANGSFGLAGLRRP